MLISVRCLSLETRWHVVPSGCAVLLAFGDEQGSEFGLANAHCVRQHRVNTGSKSPGDGLMTPKTSAVAVCCSSDSRNSFSSRVFSMAMTAWAGKIGYQRDLLIGEQSYLRAVNADGADELVVLEHRDEEMRPRAGRIRQI